MTPKLHWFAFDLNAYISNTMRLTTEAHGAYLLLMLDYYSTGEPCPDDDDQLAAITKLPVDVWKEKYRKVLAPLFDIRSGVWHHDRIATELATARERLVKRSSAARAGAQALIAKGGGFQKGNKARTGQKRQKDTDNERPNEQIARTDNERSIERPTSDQSSVEQAHLHLQSNSLSARERAGDLIGEEERAPAAAPPRAPSPPPAEDPPDPPAEIGTPIPDGWRPSVGMLQRCAADGATDVEIDAEITTFVYDRQASGAFSHDWNASFGKWWQRFKEHKAKQEAKKPKGKPRVEVNTTIDWDREIVRWKGNNSRWHRGLGPEPGQINCVCPPDLLRKHGIDPKTGLPLHEEADTTPNGAT